MKIYRSENNNFYYEGQILEKYDLHGDYLENVKINKFIKHNNYITVNLQSLKYKTKNISLNVDILDKFYKGRRE